MQNEEYAAYSVQAVSVSNSSAIGSTYLVYSPDYITVSPSATEVLIGESVTLSAFYDDGDSCACNWYINDEQVMNNSYQFTYTPDSAGTTIITAKWSLYPPITTTVSVTAIDNGGTDEPDPSPDPSPEPSPNPSDDWVTVPEMNESQSNQTTTILSAITEAVQEIKTAVQNDSRIYDLFTQSFVYHDFDFNTGKLSTQGVTLNGFVPTFNHFVQNVEQYLGMLVDVRASEDEEEVKENSKGFWTIVSGLFKTGENGEKATADTGNMNSILGFGDNVKGLFDTGGDVNDIFIIINSNDSWMFFTDEVAQNIDSTPSTYSRYRYPTQGYTDKVYEDYYKNVLGKEWRGD